MVLQCLFRELLSLCKNGRRPMWVKGRETDKYYECLYDGPCADIILCKLIGWVHIPPFPLYHWWLYSLCDFTTFFLLLLGFFAFLCFISLCPLFLLAKYRCKWWICDAYYLGKFLFVFILIVVYWKVCYPFTFVYWWAGLSLGTARRACVGIIDELVRPMIAE